MIQPIIVYTSEVAPFIQRLGMPWNNLTFQERLAVVKQVLAARATPEAQARLRLINLGVPTASAFEIVGSTR